MRTQTFLLLGALRRITQALDTHSKFLEQSVGFTVPQMLVLEASRFEAEPLSAGRIAERVSLSQGTVTLILDKLESRGLVSRARDEGDRRKVLVSLTAGGRRVLESAPPLMQAQFIRQFESLGAEQRKELVRSLERVAELMHSPEEARLTPVA
ncbi:MarR family transcriptional regulator [Algiphilus sp. W345]|uniref:MarR family transcriptional regulator n=1 Tax=Banduia mediterranea TaxID=3075609 RepID=A0ABU2WD70_9GAMM|nr:MarR family transcriptional regulator [Algiphilus sp. W345]MDT0495833.1 MarR family transcriptional regulator [Algiphilus sp. W345]